MLSLVKQLYEANHGRRFAVSRSEHDQTPVGLAIDSGDGWSMIAAALICPPWWVSSRLESIEERNQWEEIDPSTLSFKIDALSPSEE